MLALLGSRRQQYGAWDESDHGSLIVLRRAIAGFGRARLCAFLWCVVPDFPAARNEAPRRQSLMFHYESGLLELSSANIRPTRWRGFC
jgi:hypothetical protein